jgi:hypothetical protein
MALHYTPFQLPRSKSSRQRRGAREKNVQRAGKATIRGIMEFDQERGFSINR